MINESIKATLNYKICRINNIIRLQVNNKKIYNQIKLLNSFFELFRSKRNLIFRNAPDAIPLAISKITVTKYQIYQKSFNPNKLNVLNVKIIGLLVIKIKIVLQNNYNYFLNISSILNQIQILPRILLFNPNYYKIIYI